MGLLDRLSYRNSREIPRNWKMTSMDADRIESKMHNPVSSIQLHQENSVVGRFFRRKKNNGPLAGSYQTDASTSPPDPPKRKRHEIIIDIADVYRRRVHRKRHEKGNNQFGRSGTLRCGQCRRRKSKVNSHGLS